MNRTIAILVILSVALCGGFCIQSSQYEWPKPFYRSDIQPNDSLKIELGRVLFYDPLFSADGQTSCASCHSSYHAFAHTDHALSHGVFDSIGKRNAPALFNLAWRRLFMRDGAIHQLELQTLAPLHSANEMGSHINTALNRINQNPHYRKLNFQAWGDSTMSATHFLKSLTYFELILTSQNSWWDKVQNGTARMSEIQNKGLQHFQSWCSDCHTPPLFHDQKFHSVLDTMQENKDQGRYIISQQPEDKYGFSTPSLRNLGFTYPYGHDGRFEKLRTCLESHLIEKNEIKIPLGNLLDESQITELIAFLYTLNDTSFVSNGRFQFPRKSFLMQSR
jgi:cytochrome c peroxidase